MISTRLPLRLLLLAVLVTGAALGHLCRRSDDCSADQCCRDVDRNTNLVNNLEGTYLDSLRTSVGQCVSGPASPGALCDSQCSCPAGHECYRMTTGACCAPYRCYTVAEAQADRDRWRCGILPPMAPPPSGRRRRSLFQSLCPPLPLVVNPGPGPKPGLSLSPDP